jgi:hypothetical protein
MQEPTGLEVHQGHFFSNLLPNILVIAGIMFMFVIVYSGFNIVINAGNHANPQMINKHKGAFFQALIGFLIVVSAFFILQITSIVVGINLLNPNI